MKFKLLLIGLLCIGCSDKVDNKKKSNPDKYIAFVSVCAGVSGVAPVILPPEPDNPAPKPDDLNPKNCAECSGKGWLGDGQPRADCPDCDSDGDGNPDDPKFGNKEEEQEEAQPEVKSDGDLSWLQNSEVAINLAKENNKPIFVLLSDNYPEEDDLPLPLIDILSNKYVTLYGNTSDSDLHNKWASRAVNSALVEKNGDAHRFKESVFCVLNQEGNYVSYKNGEVYNSTKGFDVIDLVDSLENISKEITNKKEN